MSAGLPKRSCPSAGMLTGQPARMTDRIPCLQGCRLAAHVQPQLPPLRQLLAPLGPQLLAPAHSPFVLPPELHPAKIVPGTEMQRNVASTAAPADAQVEAISHPVVATKAKVSSHEGSCVVREVVLTLCMYICHCNGRREPPTRLSCRPGVLLHMVHCRNRPHLPQVLKPTSKLQQCENTQQNHIAPPSPG